MRLALSCWCLCSLLQGATGTPVLSAGNIVNAADRSSGRVVPGEIVVIHPDNVGPTVLVGARLDSRGRVMTELGETRVLFDGIPAPLSYAVAGQLAAVVPYEISSRKTVDVVVEYQGQRSSPVTLPVVESAPAVFTLDLSGQGQAAILNETGCCNSARNPAKRGSLATLYATGEGQTRPRGITGSVPAFAKIADYPVPRLPVRVAVGGKPAEIVYAGAAPHAVAGQLQVNFRVPANAPLGDAVPVVLTVGNSRSADGVTMAIRSRVQRVLVLDPSLAARNRLGRILASAGYDVSIAENGPEALAEAKQHPIDLLISSLAIPEDEKLETIRTLQKERPQLRIIAAAEAPGPATLKEADLLGAQAVLTTPVAPQSLLRRVRAMLQPATPR